MNTKKILQLGAPALFLALSLKAAPDLNAAIEDGKLLLDARIRYENADNDVLAASEALTLRTRLGYETGVVEGFSALIEFEDIRQLNEGDQANLAGQNATGVPRTPIADPEETELNRAWVRWQNEMAVFTLGRQRVIFDDSRFVGNVGWRQNEQTFDAVRFGSGGGEEAWSVDYLYIDKVQRIFGDAAPGGSDFDADSHLLRGSYAVNPALNVVGFVYLQQLKNQAGAWFEGSNNTYGLRATGTVKIDESWNCSYAASYALQTDNGGSPAGSDFELNYYSLFGKISRGPATLGLGWERLEGNGTRMFTTPLATLHAFNGWADVFLGSSTGGGLGSGLDDIYLDGSYKVPVGKGLLLRAVYHWFSPESGHGHYGTELDLFAVYPVTKQTKLTAKFADFDSDSVSFVDTTKLWLQVDFAY